LTEKIKIYWVYGISVVFILLNILFILKDFYWFLLAPLFLIIALLYIFSMDKILLMITFFTPLSLYLVHSEFNLGVSLPAEPLMFGVLIIFVLKIIAGYSFDKKILRHPLTIAVMANLVWIFITTLTSELPFVSVKFLIARLWFVIPFFFVGAVLFNKFSNTKRFIWLYLIGLVIVIIYATIRHGSVGFTERAGGWAVRPFYNDHTAYGAVIAMFLPFVAAFVFDKTYKFHVRMSSLIVLLVLLTGILFSYSRAAWISVAVGFAVYLIILTRINFKYLFGIFIVLALSLYSFQHQIIETLERNRQDSSADLIEHVQSIYNISSDASNLERINRWQAGIRMFEERPFLGWGPGTYQFLYAPFQRSKEKTIISTNLGDMGNAHSEYIGPLAEQGFFGMLTMVIIIVIAVYTALKVARKTLDSQVRMMAIASTVALITYFVHGFLNNFLDTDKASVPVWGFLAMILALDIYHTGKKQEVQ
jgi:putative inorganic carbon (hco3(-)) transporter